MRRQRLLLITAALVSVTLWAYACGDGTMEPPPDPPRPTTVTVSPATADLAALGATVQLTAQVLDQNGQVMAGATVTWASGTAAVATVNASGLVTAVANGAATITATAGQASGSAAMTVAQVVSAVTVTPDTATVVEGDTLRLAATATDANGHAVAAVEFEWASGDTLVALVDTSGLVTGVGGGQVQVTATTAEITGRAALTIVAPVPTTVAVTPDTVVLGALGHTAQLTAEVRDQGGRAMVGVPVAWSSGDTAVAVVDSSGLVRAVRNGAVTVTATAGEASGGAHVNVRQSAGSVTVSPPADTVQLSDTLRLVAEAYDETGHLVEGAVYAWSSSDAAVATVDASGLVRAAGEGTAAITATAGDVSGTSEITVVHPDRVALVALYNETDGPNWVDNTNWLTDAPLGEWYGVGTVDGRVVRLDLSGQWDNEARQYVLHGLRGELPDELAKLTQLMSLSLSSNDLSGPIPPELGDLSNLEQLDLGANGLSGAIPPELGNLAYLKRLSLYRNDLTGEIPPELGNLVNLEVLSLSGSNLSGEIPVEIASLANLRFLAINDNRLTGELPAEIGNLGNLQSLQMWSNRLTGEIPPQFGNLANLSSIYLDGNQLTGAIPAEMGNLASLQALWIRNNQLTGEIPPELGKLADLSSIHLDGNQLTGAIPSEMGNLASLRALSIRNNQLTDPIPSSFLQRELASLQIRGNESLCIPGTSVFLSWLRGIEDRDEQEPLCNVADVTAIESLFHATGGASWTESGGWLSDDAVEEWYGITADSLGRVTELDLEGNGLTGHLSSTLGDLTRMTVLRIGANALTGRLPLSLAALPLDEFRYAETQLCAPTEASFQGWLSAIASLEGTGATCVPLSDREILEILYRATDGSSWTNNANWLTGAPLRDWHGIEMDGEGRVSELVLGWNNLAGMIPPELGYLAELRTLSVGFNNFTGRIPPELGNLGELTTLNFSNNHLTGPIPPSLGKLSKLEVLNFWNNNLAGRIPPELGNLTELRVLDFADNGLTGQIPPELGHLAELTDLELRFNRLTGSIPSELAKLTNLENLYLNHNDLTGRIPPELGNLSELRVLRLLNNSLTGQIPPELGNLSALTVLDVARNNLTGQIPPELGNLGELDWLYLYSNGLTGQIPPELGNLAKLDHLFLTFNDLSGSVPPELGSVTNVRAFSLAHNPELAGPLPRSLTGLSQLSELFLDGTGLCVPEESAFQAWLGRIPRHRIAVCVPGSQATAYLTQAVQSRAFPVPLVADEKALLRVFLTTNTVTNKGIPLVRARFYRNGRETYVQDIPGKSDPIPIEMDESTLSRSANAEIPAWVVQPGLEMVIDVDPDSTLDSALGVASRIPATGRLAVHVESMPVFDLTLIPFIWAETHDSSIVDLIDAMAFDPENHEMLGDTRTLLPVGELAVTAHEPVLSSSNSAYAVIRETSAIRTMEGGAGHYMGVMSTPVTDAFGLAPVPGRVSFSVPEPSTIAHELGHNLYLYHAPCGGADFPDFSYPNPDGSIGAWGYDFRDDGRLVPPSTSDLMSYCGPNWISDFHFSNALRFRLLDEGSSAAAVSASKRSLLLWGGVGADSVPYLEPAFVINVPPALPDSAGEYRMVGRGADGGELFSLSFTMPEMADGDGSSSFAFALPVRAGWEGSLASVTLSGPGGSVTLDGESDIPMVILRNPRTGQVQGILRDPPFETEVAADAVGARAPGLEVLFSRGVPGAAAWRR